MQHYTALESIQLSDSWVTIGTFDGVHIGHQVIIEALVGGARQAGVPSVVITFHPHPADVLGKRNGLRYLTLPDERAQILGGFGVDHVITLTFNHTLANLTAKEFVSVCVKRLRLSRLVLGHDFALGRGREGDVAFLTRIGNELNYQIIQPPQESLDGVPVSSSLIRGQLADGKVAYAANLLGRLYRLRGIVVHGDDRGRSIGIPTANLMIDAARVIPKPGVYACWAYLQNRRLSAVVNIGFRPTFEQQASAARVEAHILNFDSDIYGQELGLEFVDHLRDEKRFSGVQALVDQIHLDINQAKLILSIE